MFIPHLDPSAAGAASMTQCTLSFPDGTRCPNLTGNKGPGDNTSLCPEHQTDLEAMQAETDARMAGPTVTERLNELEHLPVIAMNKPSGAVTDS